MEPIADFFKEEDDYLFQKGEVKVITEAVTRQIVQFGFSDEQIANTLGFSIDFIQSVRKRLKL